MSTNPAGRGPKTLVGRRESASTERMDRYGWHDGNDWVSMGLMMMFFWSVVVAVLVGFAYFARRQQHGAPSNGPVHSSARRLLDERFAKGDIDEADYVKRSELLNR